MISNQILQNTIEGLKGITRIDFCVMDTDGKSLASTFSEQENYVEEVISFVESPADSQVDSESGRPQSYLPCKHHHFLHWQEEYTLTDVHQKS